MYRVILFFFFYCQASINPDTIIIHMPGTCDGGFDFLNPPLNDFDIKKRFSTDMNSDKKNYIQ